MGGRDAGNQSVRSHLNIGSGSAPEGDRTDLAQIGAVDGHRGATSNGASVRVDTADGRAWFRNRLVGAFPAVKLLLVEALVGLQRPVVHPRADRHPLLRL